jgi:hypothetical protein
MQRNCDDFLSVQTGRPSAPWQLCGRGSCRAGHEQRGLRGLPDSLARGRAHHAPCTVEGEPAAHLAAVAAQPVVSVIPPPVPRTLGTGDCTGGQDGRRSKRARVRLPPPWSHRRRDWSRARPNTHL